MPITLGQHSFLPLTEREVAKLWEASVATHGDAADQFAVIFVDAAEMRRLNARYRQKDAPTNVLTFSYPEPAAEHEIVVCLSVAETEATERGYVLRDYVAQLLVHGFLHAAGLDHERSTTEAAVMREAEAVILQQCGFTVPGW